MATSFRRKVDRALVALRSAETRAEEEKAAGEALAARLVALEEAQRIAQQVAQQVQSRAHRQISDLVTRCLGIFDEPYVFRIEIERKRGKTEARLIFVRDGLQVDPLSASGGGVVDVAAFALRLAALLLSRPRLRRLLVLDEPFRFVSPEYRDRVRSLLEGISRDLGVQLILVTHDSALRAGTVISLA